MLSLGRISGAFGIRVASKGIAFVSSALLAVWLSPEGFGAFSFAMASAGLTTTVALGGLDRLAIRMAAAPAHEGQRAEYLSVRRGLWRRLQLNASLASGGLLLVLALMVFTNARPYVFVVLVMAPSVAATAITSVSSALLLCFSRLKEGLVPDLVVRPIAFLAAIGAVWLVAGRLSASVAAGLYSVAALSACALTWWLLQRQERVGLPHQGVGPIDVDWKEESRGFFRYAAVNALTTNLDLVILGFLLDASELGVYALATRLASIGPVAIAAIDANLAPIVARATSGRDSESIRHVLLRATAIGFAINTALLVAALLGAHQVLQFFGPGFEGAFRPLAIFCLANVVISLLWTSQLALTMSRQTNVVTMVMMAWLTIYVAAVLLVAPRYGMVAAAAALAAVQAGIHVSLTVVARRSAFSLVSTGART